MPGASVRSCHLQVAPPRPPEEIMRCREVGTARLEEFGYHTQGSGTSIHVKLRRKVFFAGLIFVKEGTESVIHPGYLVLNNAASASVTWKVAVALRDGRVRGVRVADGACVGPHCLWHAGTSL